VIASDTSEVLKLPLLREAPETFRTAFLHAVTPLTLESGRVISRQGHPCTHLPLLLRGCARVYKLGDSGREITLYRIRPGESCVLTASCMLSGSAFPAEAVTETETTAVVVPVAQALTWFEQVPHWRQFVFGMISNRLMEILGLVDEITFRRMDSRLASYLLHEGSGDSLARTHQQIADELGSAREVVSRLLKGFEAAGMIRIGRGRIQLLDRTALRQVAAG
jgi:CRP/FNR family transcriptional regulator